MKRKVELERKGILAFLIITFAITYAVEGALILSGFRFSAIPGAYGQLVVLVAMWVPTVATFVTIKFVTHERSALGNLRFGSWKPYVASAIILPLCFAIIYGLTWALGLAQPDWTLEQFRAMFIAAGTNPPPIPQPGQVLLGLLFASVVVALFFNGLVALGEEIGWRGYLLPRLMPLGKARAYLILGVIWGLWHMPLVLIGFTYPNQPILGTLMFIAMTTAIGIYINELTLENNSCVVAAWVHGIFNSQKLGMWSLLFPRFDPLLGGFSGVVGILVWLALGWWQVNRGRMGRTTTVQLIRIPNQKESSIVITDRVTTLSFNLTAKDLNSIELNGAPAVDAKNMVSDRLVVNVSGAGGIKLAGQVNQQDVTLNGTGAYDAENVEGKRATVTNNGAGFAVVRVSDELDATINGVGYIEYIGNPRVTKTVNGLGAIRQR